MRPLASVAVVAALVVGNGLLQQMSNASDRNYYRGTTWLNAATGKSVAIPSGWIHQQQTNDDKQPISIWSGPGYGATVVFAKEDVPLELDLKSYLNAWVEAVKANLMLLSPGAPTLVGAREGFTIEGTLSNDRTHRVRATLVKKGGHVWRVVILANSGKNPASEQSMKLQTLLFQSIE